MSGHIFALLFHIDLRLSNLQQADRQPALQCIPGGSLQGFFL